MLSKWLEQILRRGFSVGVSTGKPFDPRNQERTDPIKDMVERDKKRRARKSK